VEGKCISNITTYDPPLNKINPISPTNPNRDAYLDAAFDFLKRYGVIK